MPVTHKYSAIDGSITAVQSIQLITGQPVQGQATSASQIPGQNGHFQSSTPPWRFGSIRQISKFFLHMLLYSHKYAYLHSPCTHMGNQHDIRVTNETRVDLGFFLEDVQTGRVYLAAVKGLD